MAYHVRETSHKPFSCLFTANPKPTAELQLGNMTVDGTHVKSTSKYEYNISLSIRELKLKTAGVYRCLVSFSESPVNVNRTAQLQGVQLVTLIFVMMGFQLFSCLSVFASVTLVPNIVNITTPQTIVLHCSAFGFPIPSVTWNRKRGSDNVVLTPSSSPSLDYTKRKTVSTLTLNGAFLNEAGNYTCLASNSLQKDGMSATAVSSVTSLRGTLKAHVKQCSC